MGVQEDEGLLRTETEGDDVLDVADAHVHHMVITQLRPVQIFFIVSDLNDKRHIESLLHVSVHDKWNGMPEVKCLSGGASAGVHVEELAGLVSVEYQVEVPVAEEDASADEPVGLPARALRDLRAHLLSHGETSEFLQELVIVNALVAGCLDSESRNDILYLLFGLFLFPIFYL